MKNAFIFSELDATGKMTIGCETEDEARQFFNEHVGAAIVAGYRPRHISARQFLAEHPDNGLVRINWFENNPAGWALPDIRPVHNVESWPVLS